MKASVHEEKLKERVRVRHSLLKKSYISMLRQDIEGFEKLAAKNRVCLCNLSACSRYVRIKSGFSDLCYNRKL